MTKLAHAPLPPGFEALEPFVDDWGATDSALVRLQLRQRSTPDRLKTLYAVGAPMLQAIFEHLDQFSVDSVLPEPELCLYRVAHGIIEAGQFVEVYGGKAYQATFQSTEPIEGYRFGLIE